MSLRLHTEDNDSSPRPKNIGYFFKEIQVCLVELFVSNTLWNYEFGIISIANPLLPHPFERQLQALASHQGMLHQQFSKSYLYFTCSMFKPSLPQVPDAGLDILQWKLLSCKIMKGKHSTNHLFISPLHLVYPC